MQTPQNITTREDAMRIARAEISCGGSPADRWEKVDFAVHTNPLADVTRPGDVRTYCTEKRCEGMRQQIVNPRCLNDQIQATLKPGVRAMLGNAKCELTFRHMFRDPRENVYVILRWAEEAYAMIGEQLVLAPMDYDLIHDVMSGSRLLRWSAKHCIPLLIFCGYRFLFSENAFGHIRQTCAYRPMNHFDNPYSYPYANISKAVRSSGAEVWSGAGHHEGLDCEVLEKARDFGFAAIVATREAWMRSHV